MAVMDFPNSPLTGDKWPVPAVPSMPVYIYDGEKWTTMGNEVDDVVGASSTVPQMDGIATAGVEGNWSRGDHVHPTDTTRAPINAPVFTGDARAETPLITDNDTSIATTAYVNSYVASGPAGAGATADALAFNSLVINGGMEVNQQGNSVVTTTNAYACDCWRLGKSGTMAVTMGQYFNDTALAAKGLYNSLYIGVTTAQTSLGTGDRVSASHPVEGWRIQRLAWGTAAAQTLTIGFWSANQLTGVYSVAVVGGSLSYATTYTQAASAVWQYNTITIPGPTTGTWGTTYSVGLTLHFTLAAGTVVTASSANTWLAGTFYAAPGQINGVSAVNATVLRISGVVALPGTVALPELRSAMCVRPYGEELALCQRYYQRMYGQDNSPFAVGMAQHSSLAWVGIRFPRMRTVPTITLSGPTDFFVLDPGYAPYASSLAVNNATSDSARLEITTSSAFLTINHIVLLLGNGNASFITLDARL